MTGSLSQVRVNAPLTIGQIEDWKLGSDANWVVYEAPEDNEFRWSTTVDELRYAVGPLAEVAGYTTDASGPLVDAVAG